jgi:hypothetical protein
MQPFEKEQPPGVGAPKAAARNDSNTVSITKKRRKSKRLDPKHITRDQVQDTVDSLYRLLMPFLYYDCASQYLLLRDDVEIALERDGRVRVETIDIFDALWDVLKDREENATGRKEAR